MNEDELDRVQNVNIKLNPIAWRYRFHADPRLIARFSWLFDNQGKGLIQRGNQIVKSAESFESETITFESFRGRWNAGQTREIEGVRVKKMWNGAFRLDFQGESTIIRDGIF